MTMAAINYAMHQKVGDPAQRMLLFCIAHHTNGDFICTAGQKLLGDEAECCERTVRRYLDALEEKGFIKRSKRLRKNGSRTTDVIEIVGLREWDGKAGSLARSVKENPADNLSGSPSDLSGATGQQETGATGQQVSAPEPSTINPDYNPEARERAKDEFSGLKKGAQAALSRIEVTRADPSWNAWITWLGDKGYDRLAQQATDVGRFDAASRWPTPDSPPPRVPPRTAPITDRIIGEGAA